ncbi:MAG: hypothetical protein CMM94_03400 [Rickettsiales bacterium]|nr:hypothetical protein [Rickettsiales bacterium]
MAKEITEERLKETATKIQDKLNADKQVRAECEKVALALSRFNESDQKVDPDKIQIKVSLTEPMRGDSVGHLSVQAFLKDAVVEGLGEDAIYASKIHGLPILQKALQAFPSAMREQVKAGPVAYHDPYDKYPVMSFTYDVPSERQLSALENHFRDKVMGIF